MPQYIELNRTFFDYSENEDIEDAAVRSYIAGLQHGVLDWAKLLQSQCVVILGEAGSGKTEEMKHQAETIFQAGGYAFFLRLEQLIDKPVDLNTLISEPPKRNRYAKWTKNPRQNAVFFLDAKDEAALKSSYALRDALAHFTAALSISNLSHSHVSVVLSCRVSEWRPNTDLDTVRRCFDLPEKEQTNAQEKEKAPDLRIVQLAPLDRTQVKCLAGTDADAFLAAVDARHAWQLMGRPLDVQNFINYWRQYQQLGTLRELLEYDVECKLVQHGDTHKDADPLPCAEARQAAEALAAATLFCKEFKFALPHNDAHSQGIAPNAVLPANWDNRQINYVLNRPLFDEAIYGHVRFHHRQTAEYLAASWLNTLLANDCPLADIESLLFVERYGQAIVPPSRAPAAAWLAVIQNETWNQAIRQRLIQAHPDILLRYGDPQSLSIPDRRGLLSALMEKYQSRQRVQIKTDYQKLALFAVPELAQDINAYLQNSNLTMDLRILLLEFVETGRLSDCVATALDIFQQFEERVGEYAARAICVSGSPEQQRQLISMIQTYPVLSNRLSAIVLQELYPSIVNTKTMADLLKKTAKLSRNSASTLPYVIERHLETNVPDKDLDVLLVTFVQLLNQPPFIRMNKKTINFSDRYGWLGKTLGVVVQRLLKRKELHSELIAQLAEAMDVLALNNEAYHIHGNKVYLVEESKKHPLLRRFCAWRYIHANYSEVNRRPFWFDIFDYYFPLQGYLQIFDIDWLIVDAKHSETQLDRKTALILAISLWNDFGRKWVYRKRFREVLKRCPELKATWRDNVRNTIPWYLIRKWYQIRNRYNLYDLRWKLDHLPDYFKNKWQDIKNYVWLLHHLPGLRNGKEWYALFFLMKEAKNSDNMKWGTADWQSLRPLYGRRIAQAARSGWKAHWRTFTPLLPHEKPEANQTDWQVILGLTGLYTEFADGLDAARLSPQEARLATMYAVHELNGFPEWFYVLVHGHKEAVHAVLLDCIQGEWRIPAEQEQVHQVLSKLDYAAPSLQTLVYEDVLKLLLQAEPDNHSVLTQALRLVMGQAEEPQQAALSRIAQQRLQALMPDDSAFMMWLIIWLQREAVGAVAFVRTHLGTAEHPGKFMEKLCAALSGHHGGDYPQVKNPAYWQAAILEELIPLVHQYVRPEEDITHEGMYSPNARDEAQRFRDGVLPKLAGLPTPEAYQALTRLAEHPVLSNRRDWIYQLLMNNAELSAEETPWQPRQVAKFAARFAKPSVHHSITQNVYGNDNTFSATGDIEVHKGNG